MELIKKNPMDILYDIFKDSKINVPIYKWTMNEDENSIPDTYILLKSDMANSSKNYGDGKCLTRQSDCDIILVSKGNVTSSTNKHNRTIKKIADLLENKEIEYFGVDLGYSENLKSTQYTFSTTVNYLV